MIIVAVVTVVSSLVTLVGELPAIGIVKICAALLKGMPAVIVNTNKVENASYPPIRIEIEAGLG